MGTPIPLELSVWADPPSELPHLDKIGQQVLSLTRLNWASSRSFCHEPITTKFAGDIARLMTAFMEDPNFTVNPSLRGIPWFL
jgi:argonaute-like protein implicated in RNA metabolism and viral defense